jgi:RNA recognition motif-containing protein
MPLRHFLQAGPVVFTRVFTRPDGRSKGCGIVEYTSAEDARAAIEMLNESTLRGRQIAVRENRAPSPREERTSMPEDGF